MPMSAALKQLILFRRSGGTIDYTFNDSFNADVSAPLSAPLNASPGPGQWTTVTDVSSVANISGGLFNFAGSSDAAIVTAASVRPAGSCLWLYLKVAGGYQNIGYGSENMRRIGTLNAMYDRDGILSFPLTDTVFYRHAQVYTGTAIHFFVKGGSQYSDWTRWWVRYNNALNTNVRVTGTPGTITTQIDWVREGVLPLTFVQSITELSASSPVSGTLYTGPANGLIDMSVTAPASLDGSASTRTGFYYRADADLSPAWHLYLDGTGALNLDSIDASGTRTNRVNVASAIAGGQTRILRAECVNSTHRITRFATAWLNAGSAVTLSLNDNATGVVPDIAPGWSASNLYGYNRDASPYASTLNLGG